MAKEQNRTYDGSNAKQKMPDKEYATSLSKPTNSRERPARRVERRVRKSR